MKEDSLQNKTYENTNQILNQIKRLRTDVENYEKTINKKLGRFISATFIIGGGGIITRPLIEVGLNYLLEVIPPYIEVVLNYISGIIPI